LRGSIYIALALALVSCRSPGQRRQAQPGVAEALAVTSNVLRRDYVGSTECSYCHADIYEAWRRSPMHRMTRDAAGDASRAPFDGAVFNFKGGRAVMETRGDRRFVHLHPTLGDPALYRITRVIGGRYREDFAGIDVTGTSDPQTDAGRGEERVMPVSYVFSTRSWRYKGYSVLVTERPRLQVSGVWRTTCVFCHNTVPHIASLYDDLLDGRGGGYQGSMTNNLLPKSRRWKAVVTDSPNLVGALSDEIEFLGGDASGIGNAREALAESIRVTRQRFGPEHFVEVGIGCESCHGGGRQHTEDPRRLPTFEVRSELVAEGLASGARPSRAQSINRTCMRCHTVLFSRYAHTWEGGHRRRDPGGSNINSGEARDFALGGCASQLSCTSCHDPHAEDDPAGLEALAGSAGNRLCATCHPTLASREAVAAHTHHDPDGAGSSCVGCHMPRKNMGLGYRLTRYHRIGSPTDRERVERDRPLECALCHADRSVVSLVEQMERWWGRRYDRDRLRALYGADLGVNALGATLRRGKPHEQTVAAAVLGESGDRAATGLIAAALAHRYPLVRYFAAQALADLLGQWPPVDLDAEPAEIRAAARAWLRDR
jgi:predicted CXXCH cytochrome family protein